MAGEQNLSPCHCGLRSVVENHINDFNVFKGKMEVTMQQTASTLSTVGAVKEDTQHLTLLPEIKTKIENQGDSMIRIFQSLSKNIFALLLVLVFVLAAVVVVIVLKDSHKEFRASGSGFSITDANPTERSR